jgi:hypothetical protein
VECKEVQERSGLQADSHAPCRKLHENLFLQVALAEVPSLVERCVVMTKVRRKFHHAIYCRVTDNSYRSGGSLCDLEDRHQLLLLLGTSAPYNSGF